jgi:hypothetical protein
MEFTKVAELIKMVEEVQEWADNNRSAYYFDDFVGRIYDKLKPAKEFAEENNIPFVANAEKIARDNYDDVDGWSEEEESSSYYEEEESSEW